MAIRVRCLSSLALLLIVGASGKASDAKCLASATPAKLPTASLLQARSKVRVRSSGKGHALENNGAPAHGPPLRARGGEHARTIRIRLSPRGGRASLLEEKRGRPYVVVSVFSGRRRFEEILLAYLQRLLETRSLDEIILTTVTSMVAQSDRVWLGGLASDSDFSVEEVETFRDVYSYIADIWLPPDDMVNNTVVIKCDDDIVYADLRHFDSFVQYAAAHRNMFIVFANTINNQVAAYYQQRHGLIPRVSRGIDMDMPYPDGGYCGKMFDHPESAIELHRLFLSSPERFAWRDKDNDGCIAYRPPGDQGMGAGQMRFSINFFAFRYSNAREVANLVARKGGGDDEAALTTESPHTNCMYTNFVVAHYAFGMQQTAIASTDILDRYVRLKDAQLKNQSV